MDDALDVHELESLTDLPDVGCHLFLWAFLAVVPLCETPITQILHNQVNVLLVIEKPIQVSEVLVGQIGLNLYLSYNELLKFLLFYLLFWHLFKYAEKSTLALSCQKYVTECTFSQSLFYLKVVKSQFLILEWLDRVVCIQNAILCLYCRFIHDLIPFFLEFNKRWNYRLRFSLLISWSKIWLPFLWTLIINLNKFSCIWALYRTVILVIILYEYGWSRPGSVFLGWRVKILVVLYDHWTSPAPLRNHIRNG